MHENLTTFRSASADATSASRTAGRRAWRGVLALAALVWCVGAGRPAHAGAPWDLGSNTLRFAAEFDRPEELKSQFIHHYRRWGNLRTLAGNAEQEIYVDPDFLAKVGVPSLVSPFNVEGGILTITARKVPPSARARLKFPYMSGLVTTEESFSQTYGYFEIRCRMPAGKGLWPAFWLVGMTHEEPLEIDVVEVLEDAPRTLFHSIHAPGRGVEWGIKVAGPDSTAGFHTYGVDWQPEQIDFYVDRKRVGRAQVRLPGPMYMIANLAVGGKWPGNPDASTAFPASMEIDYIRAYAPRPN